MSLKEYGNPEGVRDDPSGVWWRHMVAGATAGAFSRTCTAPFDRLRAYLQVYGSRQLGVRRAIYDLAHEGGGILSFWRGNGINVLKIAPETAFKFYAYEHIKRLIKGDSDLKLTIGERFIAGASAGIFTQTLVYPLEVLKTRMILSKTGQFRSIKGAIVKIYCTEGWRSFTRGYATNTLGIIPYAGIDLSLYETLKNSYHEAHAEDDETKPIVLLACGAISTFVAQICSYPIALLRTNLQAQNVPLNSGKKAITMRVLVSSILKKDGFFGLYRGFLPSACKVIPAVCITYVVYETMCGALGVKMT